MRKGIAEYVLRRLFDEYKDTRVELECWYEMPANKLYKKLKMHKLVTRYFINN